MTKELINYEDPAIIKVIRESVAPTATDSELLYFIQYCKHSGLDPIKKEIHFLKDKAGRVNIMTGINGFLGVANSNPNFDGLQTEFHESNGKVISCTCRVWRKDRSHAHETTVWMDEYNTKIGNWLSKPRTMLEKVAKAHALREAFSQNLAGIYIEEEMPASEEEQTELVEVIEETHTYNLSLIEDEKKKDAIMKLIKERGMETVQSEEGELLVTKTKLEKLNDIEVKNGNK